MNKGSKVMLSALLLVGLAGCGTDNNDVNRNDVTNRVRTNDIGDNQNLRVSDKAARAVERLDQVDSANVIINNNNAYVAVRTNDTRTQGDRNNNTLYDNGKINQHGNDGLINGKGDAGNKNGTAKSYSNDGRNNGYGTGNGTGYGANDNNLANNMGTDINDSNVGINRDRNNRDGVLDNPGDNDYIVRDQDYKGVTTALDQKIADQVRKADKSIHKVYISYNPDFYNRMQGYTTDLTNGRTPGGLWNDFTGTVRNIFGR